MKIIYRNEPEKIAKLLGYEIKCEKCKSIFQCDLNELHEEQYGQGMMSKVIDCPVCNNHIAEYYSIGADYWKELWSEGRIPYANELK